jgi:predicted transcriptional regulator
MINHGEAPKLRALQVHNSTVYRWNRPCYGISPNGKPHLRIENRVLPSGPTVVDEVANAAFWLGAMVGVAQEYPDIRKQMSWADVRDNFGKAARYGIDTSFTWFKDKKMSAVDVITKELIPLSRQGLESRNIDSADIDKYLGIIEERAKKHMTGARWQLRAYTKLREEVSKDEALTILTASIHQNQQKSTPVHKWKLPKAGDLEDYRPAKLKVDEFMSTDLFTVQKDDLIELVTELMNWRGMRYMPVEDSKGNLVGLITSRVLLRHFSQKSRGQNRKVTMVKHIMIENPITISPGSTIMEAMYIMRDNKIGCLPVVKDGELIGMISEMEFLQITGRLMERLDKEG